MLTSYSKKNETKNIQLSTKTNKSGRCYVAASAQQASYSGPPKYHIGYRHNKIPELGP